MTEENKSLSKSEHVKELSKEEVVEKKGDLPSDWTIEKEGYLARSYSFKNFKSALAFVNQVGKIAEEAKHHPDILLRYGKVDITLFTHAVKGLSEKDFLLADQIEAEYQSF